MQSDASVIQDYWLQSFVLQKINMIKCMKHTGDSRVEVWQFHQQLQASAAVSHVSMRLHVNYVSSCCLLPASLCNQFNIQGNLNKYNSSSELRA